MIPAAPHHLAIGPDELAGNGGAGRICFLPGSEARARHIADRFEGTVVFPSARQLNVYCGRVTRDGVAVDVAAVPTGMGCPSLNIVVTELFALGARRFLRVGSAGSLQHGRVRVGDVVIATGAVRDEGTSDAFLPRDVPAVAHPDWVRTLRDAARETGWGDRAWLGLVHSKDCFYGREFPGGPLAERNRAYMALLAEAGVLATEMESSHLFVLSSVLSRAIEPVGRTVRGPEVVKAGAIVAVIGDQHDFASPEAIRSAEDAAIQISLDAAFRLMTEERLPEPARTSSPNPV